MKVLIYATGQDTGGQGGRIEDAFKKHAPDWEAISINASPSKLGYPEYHAMPMSLRKGFIRDAYRAADVIHLRNNLSGLVWDRGQHKPTVISYHGSDFREHHALRAREAQAIGAVQLAATLDLVIIEPGVTWLPSPYDVDEIAKYRMPFKDGTVRIAYYPTAGAIKSAGPFMAAYRSLAQKYRLQLLTNIGRGDLPRAGTAFGNGWKDVLRAKGHADILFDQVILGYGNNAVESWCMDVPVVAGVADPAVRAAMVERFGTLPFVEATEQTIEETLERLILSAQMRQEYGEIGLAHVRRFHDYPVAVAMLKDIYANAKPIHGLPRSVNTRLPGKVAA